MSGDAGLVRMYTYAATPEKAAEVVTSEDLKKATRYLEKSITLAAQVVENIFKKDGYNVKYFTDLLVMAFKAPFYTDVLELSFSKAFTSPYKLYLTLYLSTRILERVEELEKALKTVLTNIKDASDLTQILAETIDNSAPPLKNYLTFLQDTINEDNDYWSLYKIPVDPRPGLNMGLIPHALLASALLWALNAQKGPLIEGVDEDTLRLAVLLHICKAAHRLGSENGSNFHFLYSLLEKTSEAAPLLRKLSPQLEKLHPEKNLQLIEEAVKAVLGFQKNAGKALHALRGSLREKPVDLEALYLKDDISQLSKLKVEDLVELTQKYLEAGIESSEPQPPPEEWDVYYLVVDINEVQKLITRSTLVHAATAASFLVDYLVAVYIPYILTETYGLPIENIAVSSGGLVAALVPKKLVKEIEYGMRELGELLYDKYRLQISIMYAPLAGIIRTEKGWKIMVRDVKEVLRDVFSTGRLKERFTQAPMGEVLHLGTPLFDTQPVFCESCGLEPAEGEPIKKADEEIRVCRICKNLYMLGHDSVFIEKYESTVKLPGGDQKAIKEIVREALGQPSPIDWNRFGERVLEFIAGHTLAPVNGGLEPQEEEKMSIAVVAADGDAMGSFFSESRSLGDYLERSMTVDISLKLAIHRFTKLLFNLAGRGRAEGELARLVLGFLYVGGDDHLAVTPAYIAIPYAAALARTFSEVTRGHTLSVGIASASYMHPLWLLIEAARSLEEWSKSCSHCRFTNTFSLIHVDQGLLSSHTLEKLLDKYRELGVTTQPLSLEKLGTIAEHLGLAEAGTAPLEERILRKTLGSSGAAALEEAKKVISYYRKAWNQVEAMAGHIVDAWIQDRVMRRSIKRNLVLTLASRNRERLGGEAERYYGRVMSLLSLDGEAHPLVDAYMLYKFMGGGLR